jgi:hypothetical protein
MRSVACTAATDGTRSCKKDFELVLSELSAYVSHCISQLLAVTTTHVACSVELISYCLTALL